MAKYELTATGKKELANPKEWARTNLPIKIVECLEAMHDVEDLRPAEAVRKKLASWRRLGWVREIKAAKLDKPAGAETRTRKDSKKTRVRSTKKSTPEKPAGPLLQMASKEVA